MYELIFIFGLIFIMNLYYAKRIEYFSNFKSGNIVYGQEALMTDYVTASNNPVSNLPDQFTVCSSLFFNHLTTNKNVFEIYKEDGTHWFHLSFNPVRDLTTRTEILDLNSQTEFKNVQIYHRNVPIAPHSWYYVCLGLDTVSGLLRIPVNGILIENEMMEFFKNTTSIKPKSVSGKVSGIN